MTLNSWLLSLIYVQFHHRVQFQTGLTSLLCAASHNHLDAVRILLERGAEIEAKDSVSTIFLIIMSILALVAVCISVFALHISTLVFHIIDVIAVTVARKNGLWINLISTMIFLFLFFFSLFEISMCILTVSLLYILDPKW